MEGWVEWWMGGRLVGGKMDRWVDGCVGGRIGRWVGGGWDGWGVGGGGRWLVGRMGRLVSRRITGAGLCSPCFHCHLFVLLLLSATVVEALICQELSVSLSVNKAFDVSDTVILCPHTLPT